MKQIWKQYKGLVKKNCTEEFSDNPEVQYWKDFFFSVTIIYSLPLCFIALVPGLYMAWYSGFIPLMVYDVFAVTGLTFIALKSGIPVFLRKIIFVILLYGVGVMLLYYLGSFGPGLIYLFAATIFVILILPKNYGYATAFVNLGLCSAFTLALYAGLWQLPLDIDNPLGSWVAISSNAVFLSFLAAVMIPKLFSGLQSTIDEQNRLRDELKEQTESLEHSLSELKHTNSELEQFAKIASHDLQEPLRMVSSFMTRLEKKYSQQLDERALRYVFFAKDGAQKMKQIILDLLEYSKAGTISDPTDEVNLNEVVDSVCGMLRKRIEETKATIHVDELPVLVNYKIPLQQVFQNLIENSLKFHQKDVSPAISISSIQRNNHWKIIVKDNGIGIDPEYFDKVFIVFQRLHSRTDYSGTGLGLSLTKKIIENQGGRIWIQSKKGEGSEFHFTLQDHRVQPAG
jgi:signal transduction histidine kinase